MVLPGHEAQQLATYIGWLMHKTRGGSLASGLFVLPSLLILMVLSTIYMRFGNTQIVSAVLYGIKPVVVAVVLFSACRIGSRALKNKALWVIAFASFLAITLLQLPFPLIVISAALIGYLGNCYAPKLLSCSGMHKYVDQHFGKAVIDDDTPTPTHAHLSWHGLVKFLVIGVII